MKAVLLRLPVLALTLLSVLASTAPAHAQASPERVQPGDRVAFRLWFDGGERLGAMGPLGGVDTLVVGANGVVSFPTLGEIRITDFAVGAVRDSIMRRLARHPDFNARRTPIADVIVLRRVIVNGSVKLGNVFYLDQSASVRDAIARAGGIAEFGDRAKVALVRGDQVTPLPDWDRTTSGIELRSGDMITVGRRGWLAMNGVALADIGFSILNIIISLRR